MSCSSDTLTNARKRLVDALGDKKDDYFSQMKQWFRMKLTKEEFDACARELLSPEYMHLHNEFLLAILSRCQMFLPSSTTSVKNEFVRQEEMIQRSDSHSMLSAFDSLQSGVGTPVVSVSSAQQEVPMANDRRKLKPKKKARPVRLGGESTFEPVNLQDIALTSTLREPAAITEAAAGYHSRMHHMLDIPPLKGRLLLGAWDHGLTGISDAVAFLLQEAAKQCIKNILTAVISRRKGYKIREGKFKHSLGTLPANPWLRNSAAAVDWSDESLGLPVAEGGENGHRLIWPTIDIAEQNAAHLASCASPTSPPLRPVSCFDLFTTLQIHKSAIPCHTVYGLGMERISSHLWHPSQAEYDLSEAIAKENALKEASREHRLATAT